MKVLLAVDLREEARERVVDEAVRWAQRLGAVLDLVYVTGERHLQEVIADPVVRDLVDVEFDKVAAHDDELLEQLRLRVPEPVRGRATRVAGRPAETLADVAKPYDAVLVATHGRTGLAHFWMGSVAERLSRLSPVPVLTMRLA